MWVLGWWLSVVKERWCDVGKGVCLLERLIRHFTLWVFSLNKCRVAHANNE